MLALTSEDRDFLTANKIQVPEDAEIIVDPLEVACRWVEEARKWRWRLARVLRIAHHQRDARNLVASTTEGFRADCERLANLLAGVRLELARTRLVLLVSIGLNLAALIAWLGPWIGSWLSN